MRKRNEKVFVETCDLLQELIQNQCVNPPGNEMKSIKTIERFLKRKNIAYEVLESAPDRGNLIAKLEGTDKNHPGLIFGPSHIDVVPVTKPEEWDVEPFSGEIKDGFIWGRGAADMLFIVAAQVQAFAMLFEEGFKPKGDLILFIVADEERGGEFGTEWVLENHGEKLGINRRTMYAVTEAGGFSIAPGKLIYIIGEKGGYRKVLSFKGTPGHGSLPFDSDNAVLKASKAATLLSDYCNKKIPVNTEYVKNLVDGMEMNFLVKFFITNKTLLPIALKILKKNQPETAKFIYSLSRMTISPNIIEGGSKTNIIATEAQLKIDIRTLPGQDDEYVLKHLKKALGKLAEGVEIEDIKEEGFKSIGTKSPIESEFVRAMERTIQKEISSAHLVPLIMMSASDGRHFRKKNIDTYGYSLFNPDFKMNEFLSSIHGVNEKIDLKTLELSQEVYYNLAKEFLT